MNTTERNYAPLAIAVISAICGLVCEVGAFAYGEFKLGIGMLLFYFLGFLAIQRHSTNKLKKYIIIGACLSHIGGVGAQTSISFHLQALTVLEEESPVPSEVLLPYGIDFEISEKTLTQCQWIDISERQRNYSCITDTIIISFSQEGKDFVSNYFITENATWVVLTYKTNTILVKYAVKLPKNAYLLIDLTQSADWNLNLLVNQEFTREIYHDLN